MTPLELVDTFKTANMVVEWAIVTVPSLLGVGAIGSLGYGLFTSARGWIHHGGDMIKFGAGILAGGALGGVGGMKAVLGLRAMGQSISTGEALKMIGGEVLRGGTRAATGSRGWLQVMNRSLWSSEAEKDFLSKKPMIRTVVKKPGGITEIRERVEGDLTGATEKVLTEKVIDQRPPPSPPQNSMIETSVIEVPDPTIIRTVSESKGKDKAEPLSQLLNQKARL